ncbi:MAG: DUF2238 domain-containing protein [Desulfobacteraceae bacterium]|nr:DUF2238 domain-containing protein [Desulfobacteraceae bacterium]
MISHGADGTAFRGSRGDIWDAQWDMFLAFVGAMVGLPTLSGLHDRSMDQLPAAC